MKPGFALILSHDGISLLHRANGGWRCLGKADPQDPHLSKSLRYLQRTATELSGGQFATKIIIPNSQILYRKTEAPGFTDELRTALIHASLDGTTPYKLDDLVFDWADAGDDMADVAVVAIETLREAEKFAQDHKFNPVSFVAIPDPGSFDGEPFFGETDLSVSLLTDGDRVEPDDDIINEIEEHTLTEIPVIDVPETTSPEEDISADASEPEQAEVTPAPQDAQAEAVNFSTRRDTSLPRMDDGPLNLKWVTPRIAVGSSEHQPTISAPAKAEIQTGPQIGPQTEPQTEISKVAVTSPALAEDVAPPKKPKIKSVSTKSPVAQKTLSKMRGIKIVRRGNQPAPAPKMPEPPLDFGLPGEPETGPSRYLGVSIGSGLVAALLLVALLAGGLFGGPLASLQFWRSDTVHDLGEGQTANAVVASASFGGTDPAPDTASPVVGIEIASLVAPDISTIELALPTPEEIAESHAEPEALEILTPDKAQAAYGLTGVWQLAPIAPNDPVAGRIDDLYVASIDRAIISQDAVALPAYATSRPDQNLGLIATPAPAGTDFDLDERGLVRATPEGALSPHGIRVFAGKPAYVPTLRAHTSPALEPTPTPSTEIVGERPLPRPENLVAKTRNARLGGRTLAEIGKVRPLPRPSSPQEVVHAEAPQVMSALAITSSRKPLARPNGFATSVDNILASLAVEAAVADAAKNAPTAAEPKNVVQASAAVKATPAPSLPTRANVAKEATVKNAIKLSSINLIGVYGSSSDRRALVRLKSGRYVKVQIGDRLDGGRVASIGSGELKYVKGGKNVTLKMPTG